jgi:hypothetical protein
MMSVENKQGSSFDELLKSLAQVEEGAGTLAKAAPAAEDDDEMVAAAAAESGVDADGGNPEDDDEGGEEFGKSLGSADDGSEMVDATELVKSLMARQESTDGVLAKAMTSMVGALSKQNDMIKSLQAEVGKLASQGRGRKTLVTISEKPGIADTLAKSEGADDGKITTGELLAKSHAAHAAKKISGVELNTIDVCLRNNWPIDAGILQKVALA